MSINRIKPSLTAQILLVVTAALVAFGARANAQSPLGKFEIRPFAGAYIPTGDQRDLLKDAVLAGAQGSWRVLSPLAITASFGWSPSKDRIAAGNQTLDLYQYDVGAELRGPAWFSVGSWDFTPFTGIGGGARTYSYRDLNVNSKTNAAGYGSVGGDIGFGPLALRIEGRDYVSRFEPLAGTGARATRNDVGVAVGLGYRF
jgi:hypothetical protein